MNTTHQIAAKSVLSTILQTLAAAEPILEEARRGRPISVLAVIPDYQPTLAGEARLAEWASQLRSQAVRISVWDRPWTGNVRRWIELTRRIRAADLVHLFVDSESALARDIAPCAIAARYFGRPLAIDFLTTDAAARFDSQTPIWRRLAGAARLVTLPEGWRRQYSDAVTPIEQVPTNYTRVPLDPIPDRSPVPQLIHVDEGDLTSGGWEFFSQAFQVVKQKYPRAMMKLVMSDNRSAAARSVTARGMSDPGIEIVRTADPTRLTDLLGAADILIHHSSFRDSSGLTRLALAAGLPIVSSTPQPGPWVSFEYGSPYALADGILRLVETPGLARELARFGQEHARRQFETPDRRHWLSLYRTLLPHPA